eukprot:3131144-Amphidinium_carterae.1
MAMSQPTTPCALGLYRVLQADPYVVFSPSSSPFRLHGSCGSARIRHIQSKGWPQQHVNPAGRIASEGGRLEGTVSGDANVNPLVTSTLACHWVSSTLLRGLPKSRATTSLHWMSCSSRCCR